MSSVGLLNDNTGICVSVLVVNLLRQLLPLVLLQSVALMLDRSFLLACLICLNTNRDNFMLMPTPTLMQKLMCLHRCLPQHLGICFLTMRLVLKQHHLSLLPSFQLLQLRNYLLPCQNSMAVCPVDWLYYPLR